MLQKHDPTDLATPDVARADGRAQATKEEYEIEERKSIERADRTLDDARREIEAAARTAPHDPDVQKALGEIQGASGANKTTMQVTQIARDASDKAEQAAREKAEEEKRREEEQRKEAEEMYKTVSAGILGIVGIGAALKGMPGAAALGISWDGQHYEPAQTGSPAPGFKELPANILGAMTLKQPAQEISLNPKR